MAERVNNSNQRSRVFEMRPKYGKCRNIKTLPLKGVLAGVFVLIGFNCPRQTPSKLVDFEIKCSFDLKCKLDKCLYVDQSKAVKGTAQNLLYHMSGGGEKLLQKSLLAPNEMIAEKTTALSSFP